MTNSRASKGMRLIDTHQATGTESTYTVTQPMDLLLKYSEILILINGEATAAFDLLLKYNSVTDLYHYNYIKNDSTTVTGVNATSQAAWIIADKEGIINVATGKYNVRVHLTSADDSIIQGTFQNYGNEASSIGGISQSNAIAAITSLTISTSTSTWKAGAQINTYGIPRT